jgi:hypothetical protein
VWLSVASDVIQLLYPVFRINVAAQNGLPAKCGHPYFQNHGTYMSTSNVDSENNGPDREYELLCKLAYQSWMARGQPHGSPEVDWDFAKAELATHPPVLTQVVNTNLTSNPASIDQPLKAAKRNKRPSIRPDQQQATSRPPKHTKVAGKQISRDDLAHEQLDVTDDA